MGGLAFQCLYRISTDSAHMVNPRSLPRTYSSGQPQLVSIEVFSRHLEEAVFSKAPEAQRSCPQVCWGDVK
jgi:hypothetical protein